MTMPADDAVPPYIRAAVASFKGAGQISVSAVLVATGTVTNVPLPAPVTVKAIITPERDIPEGTLVADVGIAWFEILSMLKKDPDSVNQLDWRAWEEMIAAAYARQGFDEVILTPRANDQGRDVIAVRRGFGSIRILEQVKAYSPGNLVTAEEVRAMVGTLALDPNASKGLITTTSDFAPGVTTNPEFKPMMPFRLELKNRPQLLDWLADIERRASS